MLFVLKMAPALATGNTLVLKPAEQTPVIWNWNLSIQLKWLCIQLTALYLASLVVEAGFPPGVVNVVPGYGPTAGGAIVEHPKVDKISFTGSSEVGKLISKNGSNTLKRVTLELGGKSPIVVTENFDLKKAALIAIEGCYANMGQCCCAATRTYVHESIYEEFVKETALLAQKKVVGDPFEDATHHGPQIDAEQTEKILDLIESGKKEGARVVTGGKRMNRKGYFIEPTVFADVLDSHRIARYVISTFNKSINQKLYP